MNEDQDQTITADPIVTPPDLVPAAAVTLPGQEVLCRLEGGRELTVRVTNRERVRWDKTAPRHGWGKAEEVPHLAMTFVCWAAAKREDLFDGNFDQFADALEDYDVVKTERVPPTQ